MIDHSDLSLRWDIFCRVVDNFGDAGVCWRLASDLSTRGVQVRIFIDQPDILNALAGPLTAHENISVQSWPDDHHPFVTADVADVAIEAFACDPPDAYVKAMIHRKQPPVWINLEYLSAEDWIESHHGLSSPHPRYPLTKHFYFPGFTPKTGGLLREIDLICALDQRDTSPINSNDRSLRVFLFSYHQPNINNWLGALASSKHALSLGVAPCPALQQIIDFQTAQSDTGMLRTEPLPFVPQSNFDAVLAQFDLLFVRGEDSFVRAQWLAKPLVWHIYPQEEHAHLVKLKAFYDRYLDQGILTTEDKTLYWRFVLAWNNAEANGPDASLAELWPRILDIYPALLENARAWRNHLLQQRDLVTQLREFVAHLVK